MLQFDKIVTGLLFEFFLFESGPILQASLGASSRFIALLFLIASRGIFGLRPVITQMNWERAD